MSIFYCCLLFAVYCTLGQIWAAGGRDVIRNHMIPNDTKWHHMMLNDITWCPVTSHHHDILLHHMLMIPCYITRWWYPVQSHDVLRHHIPCQESGRWLQLLLIAPLQRSPGFRIQEMFWMWVTAAASLLYSSRGMQGHVFWGRQVDFRVQGRTITQLVSWKIMLQVPGSADKT